jgi:plasmid stabilization system protein ParE
MYLVERGEREWAARLREDLDEIGELLGRFPEAGRELARDGDASLRKLRLRRCPFVVWYGFDPLAEQATFIRLFHARQRTPKPRPP